MSNAAAIGGGFNLENHGGPIAIDYESIQSSVPGVGGSNQREIWIQVISEIKGGPISTVFDVGNCVRVG